MPSDNTLLLPGTNAYARIGYTIGDEPYDTFVGHREQRDMDAGSSYMNSA